ncbi:MAG: hypothetical protein HY579_08565 [Nitrospinae bacterium]|nr:hypothetical protein [Nitrospinota bacterium]
MPETGTVMVFFQIEDCDTRALEAEISGALAKRGLPLQKDAELIGRYTPVYFLRKYYSRPSIRVKMFASSLPRWVYSVCKVLPFYEAIRGRLRISFKEIK